MGTAPATRGGTGVSTVVVVRAARWLIARTIVTSSRCSSNTCDRVGSSGLTVTRSSGTGSRWQCGRVAKQD